MRTFKTSLPWHQTLLSCFSLESSVGEGAPIKEVLWAGTTAPSCEGGAATLTLGGWPNRRTSPSPSPLVSSRQHALNAHIIQHRARPTSRPESSLLSGAYLSLTGCVNPTSLLPLAAC